MMLGEVILFYYLETAEKEWNTQNSKAEAVLVAWEQALEAEQKKESAMMEWQSLRESGAKLKLKTGEQLDREKQSAEQSMASIRNPHAKKGVGAYTYAVLWFACEARCLCQIIAQELENTDIHE
jgi:hypothetical protein